MKIVNLNSLQETMSSQEIEDFLNDYPFEMGFDSANPTVQLIFYEDGILSDLIVTLTDQDLIYEGHDGYVYFFPGLNKGEDLAVFVDGWEYVRYGDLEYISECLYEYLSGECVHVSKWLYSTLLEGVERLR